MSDLQVLELFAGIGGVATVVGSDRIAAAIDISNDARRVYQANHSSPYHAREIDSITDSQFRQWSADLWWLSPPCQPYSRRGRGRDWLDTRTSALRRVMGALNVCQPSHIALENVSGFENSEAFDWLRRWLDKSGYQWQTLPLCPTAMGWPNRRPRFYLLASKEPLLAWRPISPVLTSWETMVESITREENNLHLWICPAVAAKYISALDRMASGVARPTACFAGSYGKTWLHSGSYLETHLGLRRFSPREIARFLGFPETFVLPQLSDSAEQSDRKLWKLLGNSLSLPVIRYVLSHLVD